MKRKCNLSYNAYSSPYELLKIHFFIIKVKCVLWLQLWMVVTPLWEWGSKGSLHTDSSVLFSNLGKVANEKCLLHLVEGVKTLRGWEYGFCLSVSCLSFPSLCSTREKGHVGIQVRDPSQAQRKPLENGKLRILQASLAISHSDFFLLYLWSLPLL